MRARFVATLSVLGVILWGIFQWAFDHFLWDSLVQFLETTSRFKEAELIASSLSYVVPIVATTLCIIAIYLVIRHEMSGGKLPQWAVQSICADRYMTAYEAIHYLADDSAWGKLIRQHAIADGSMVIKKDALLESLGEFRRIARQGAIKAIGRRNNTGQHVAIPDTYWMSAILSDESLSHPAISRTTPAVPNSDGVPIYDDVRIARKDVERTWPRNRIR